MVLPPRIWGKRCRRTILTDIRIYILLDFDTSSCHLACLGGGTDTPIGPHALCSLAFQASPSDQSAIPSSARSLTRKCPGPALPATCARAGKPPRLGSQTPGVVVRKVRVVRNIPRARALPRAHA